MLIIRNDTIPIKGFKAINLFGVLFVRNEAKMSIIDYNHEAIHTEQQKELLYVGFYVFYIIEYLIRLCIELDTHIAYRTISFEREAYGFEGDKHYIETRKKYSFTKFLTL